MKYDKFIGRYFLILISISFLVSCTSQSSGKDETGKIQEMINCIIDAGKEEDFEKEQLLCDEMYSFIRNRHDSKAELWLAHSYFILCCYNGGSENDVKMKLELYTEKYVGIGRLWESVKDMDAIWFSNIQRCEELLIRAYEDNPSLTMKELEELYINSKAFHAFANLVIKNS